MIFADASFFIAAANRRDRWHPDARRLAGALRDRLVMSDLVIAEAVTQIGGRVGVREGTKLFHYFRDDCEVRYVDSDLLEAAVDRWMTFGGKLSVSDAASLEIMARESISEIVSFDSDFDGIEGVVRRH